MNRQPYLFVESLSKTYPPQRRAAEPLVVFEDVTFGVEQGQFVSVIGHSGCGKSTILNIIAGLDQATGGYVFVNGKQVTQPGLSRGVIFQNHSLLPWKTALGNVCFSVRAKNPTWTKRAIEDHSMKYLEMVGLRHAAQRKPSELSGGMRQRVGIARAFAIEPKLLLMDEPFGALDALTRGTIQDELLSICQQTGQTVFMITHDVDEAIYLSDRILLMSNGPHARVAEQVSVPITKPRNRTSMAKLPEFYDLRARLIGFLGEHASGAQQRAKPVAAPPAAPQDDETTVVTGRAIRENA